MGKTQVQERKKTRSGANSASKKKTAVQKIPQRTHVGEYKITGKALARGGMSTIYKVVSPKGELMVAKVLSEEHSSQKKKRDRFFHEFESLRKVKGKGVIKAIDKVEEKGVSALILEYLEGHDLSRLLKKAGSMDVDCALHIVMELSRVLERCHKKGVVHRDLKPENVFITDQGEIKLLDFGVVRDMELKRTLPGTVLGTLDYMAPEQIEGRWDEIDLRADLYALGALTYECLTSKIPIRLSNNDSIVQVLEKKKKKLPKKTVIEDKVLEQFCLILIHPDPEQRPSSAKEIQDFISRYKSAKDLQKSFLSWRQEAFSLLEKPRKAASKGKVKEASKNVPTAKEHVKTGTNPLLVLFIILSVLTALLALYRFLQFKSIL